MSAGCPCAALNSATIFASFSASDFEAGPIVVGNNGAEAVDAVVTVIGASLTGEPAVSKGFRVERTYYTLDGKVVDLKSASGGAAAINQNDRLVAVVRVDSDEAAEADRLIERSSACRALFEQALETAALLALAVDGIEPDPRLRARILDAVRSEQER